MNASYLSNPSDDVTSYPVDLSAYDTQGLCRNYSLRRHNFESEANAGCQEARRDWISYIGPVEQFGNCNPINGNFTAVVLPLYLPERVRTVAYILEYAFLCDNVVETIRPSNTKDFEPTWEHSPHILNPALGKKQIEAKMMLKLLSTDSACTERVMRVWKEMLSTTVEHQSKNFRSLDEYVDFRIIDTGAPFVEAMMLWGMGMQLTPQEDEQLKTVIQPCFAALGLANDYFSFDREYAESQESGAKDTFTNSVWLHMQWHSADIQTAKDMVKEATSLYEQRFSQNIEEFKRTQAPVSEKIDRYLRALSYQVSGNVVWSLNCPRYHPKFRYDANAGLENLLTAKHFPAADGYVERIELPHNAGLSERSNTSDTLTTVSDGSESPDDAASTASSVSEHIENRGRKPSESFEMFKEAQLSAKHVEAPYDYIISLPSKGVQDAFIDALNIWLDVPEPAVTKIKRVANKLHSASLMLDDVEDGSDLRRGSPTTHTVFGVAQTINSANYAIIEAAQDAGKICPEGTNIVLGDLLDLHVGQSCDLFWTRHGSCPSEDEYIKMVTKKTGGLFRLITRLMMNSGSPRKTGVDIENFVELIGIHFQIRDDYQNLVSAEYSSQKGFCEDLNEDKFSFPLIQLWNSRPNDMQIREIFQQRRDTARLSKPHKQIVLQRLKDAGSMEHTRKTLERLQGQIEADVGRLEAEWGRKNWVVRLLLHKLWV